MFQVVIISFLVNLGMFYIFICHLEMFWGIPCLPLPETHSQWGKSSTLPLRDFCVVRALCIALCAQSPENVCVRVHLRACMNSPCS